MFKELKKKNIIENVQRLFANLINEHRLMVLKLPSLEYRSKR